MSYGSLSSLHSPTDEKGDQSGREAHDFMSQFLSKILACKLVSVACEPSLWPLLPRAPGNYSSLLRIIARAHDIQGRLSQNTKLTVHDIELLVAAALPARDRAVAPFDRGSPHAAALSWANSDTAWANANCGAIAPTLPIVAVVAVPPDLNINAYLLRLSWLAPDISGFPRQADQRRRLST
jgi:hypothetical protein